MKKYGYTVLIASIICIINTAWGQINVDKESFNFNSVSTPQTLTVSTGSIITWQVAGTIPGWLALSTTSGTGETMISVKPANNVLRESRNASFNLTIPGTSFSKLIEVSQSGAPLALEFYWELSLNTDNIPAEGVSFNLAVQSYGSWKIIHLPDWLILSTISGARGSLITGTVSPNFSIERNALITFTNSIADNSLMLHQVAHQDVPGQIYGKTIYAEKSGGVKIQFYGSTSKQVRYNANWINHEGSDASIGIQTIKNLSISGNYSLTVSANNTGSPRFATVTVLGISGAYTSFELIQAGSDKYINIEGNKNIPSTAGIYQLTVTSNVSWKVYNHSNSLASKISPLNGGEGVTFINVTIPANNLYEFFYPELTFYSTDHNAWSDFKFTQDKGNVSFSIKEPNIILTSASGYYLRVTPLTNLPSTNWNISANNMLPGWIALYGQFNNILYFEITQPNTTAGILTTAITITFTGGSAVLNVTQAGQNFTPHLEISLPQNVNKDGGIYTVTITSNISHTPSADYFLAPDLYSYYNILTRNIMTGDALFSITVPANNFAFERKYAFTWAKPEDDAFIDYIIQQPGTGVTLNVIPTSLFLDSKIESYSQLFINTNTDSNNPFMITQVPSWLSFSIISGAGYNTIYSSTIEENTGDRRVANVVVTIAGAPSKSFNVIQEAPGVIPYLNVDKTSFIYGAEGGTGSFTITTNNKWSISSLPNARLFASFSAESGMGTALVNFTINGILDDMDHVTIYFVKDAFLNSQQITLTTLAKGKKIDALLEVPVDLSIGYTAGSYVVTIGSNISWSASGPDWIAISPSATNGTTLVTLNVSENPVNFQRTAIITVTGGGLTKSFNVIQAGSTITGIDVELANDSIYIYPNPTSGSFTLYAPISGTTNIYNLIGVQVGSIAYSKGKNKVEFDLPSGIYILKTGARTFKLVVK